MTATATDPDLAAAVLAVARAHRLRRCMLMAQQAALRHARAGRHRLASQRWGLLLSLHVERNRLLRRWGIRP